MKRTSNKRSQELKNILIEREPLLSTKDDLMDNTADTQISCKNVRTVCFGECTPYGETNTHRGLAESIELFHRLIDKELIKAANVIDIDREELKAWFDLQIEVPANTILNLLRTIQSLHLDPLNEEISFTKYEDGVWQIIITIEGCVKIMNNNSQFNGLTFTQSDALIEGVPEWIECSIYRRDRILPITVREHYLEVRGETAIWQKMPRRMLRHRALQQCVRLAL